MLVEKGGQLLDQNGVLSQAINPCECCGVPCCKPEFGTCVKSVSLTISGGTSIGCGVDIFGNPLAGSTTCNPFLGTFILDFPPDHDDPDRPGIQCCSHFATLWDGSQIFETCHIPDDPLFSPYEIYKIEMQATVGFNETDRLASLLARVRWHGRSPPLCATPSGSFFCLKSGITEAVVSGDVPYEPGSCAGPSVSQTSDSFTFGFGPPTSCLGSGSGSPHCVLGCRGNTWEPDFLPNLHKSATVTME